MLDAEREEIMWQGKFVTAKRQGKWEYVSRSRGIKAAVILAVEDGHVLLVEQFRVPLGKSWLRTATKPLPLLATAPASKCSHDLAVGKLAGKLVVMRQLRAGVATNTLGKSAASKDSTNGSCSPKALVGTSIS